MHVIVFCECRSQLKPELRSIRSGREHQIQRRRSERSRPDQYTKHGCNVFDFANGHG
jgi:hypothetical protein